MIMSKLLHREETYAIIGKLFEVHNNLGGGFLEVVYKDALEFEFNQSSISFDREKRYSVNYKGNVLKHEFFADFVVFDKIILEIKAVRETRNEAFVAQCLNYLRISGCRVAILANFGLENLDYQRIVL